MNNNKTISFKDLQNHEVAPPPILLNNIKNKIDDVEVDELRKTFSPLYDNNIAIPSSISFEQLMQKINSSDPINIFKKLEDYDLKSPISFENIIKRLKQLGYFKSKDTAKVISIQFIKKIAVAAAVAATLFIGYFLVNQKSHINNGSSFAASENINNNNSKSDLPQVTDSLLANNNVLYTPLNSNKTNKKFSKLEKLNRKVYSRRFTKKSSENNEKPLIENFSINGENFTVIENDYLATFASFSSDKLPAFLSVETPEEVKITVDKYSNFNITDGMGAMMKKMYATKKSGAPTRSAKKQKEKLEKWKALDSAYFKNNINPLDPRDLGNLILNK